MSAEQWAQLLQKVEEAAKDGYGLYLTGAQVVLLQSRLPGWASYLTNSGEQIDG